MPGDDVVLASDVGLEARLQPSVGYAVIETGARLLRATNRLVRGYELSLVQFYALTMIGDAPGITQARLAEKLAIDAPRAVIVVDSLEKFGLARRSPAPHDRRVRALLLTETGRRIAEEIVQISLDFDKELTRGMNRDEQRTLLSLLGRLRIE